MPAINEYELAAKRILTTKGFLNIRKRSSGYDFDAEKIGSALYWAILGMLSTLAVLTYLSLRLSIVFLGKGITGTSLHWFTAGLILFIIPSTLAVLIYLTWIRPLQKKQRPSRLWQLALITLGTVLYILPGLVLIIGERKLKRLTLEKGRV